MRRIISSVVISIVLGGFTVAAAQLPPEIMMDRYLVRVERLIAESNREQGQQAARRTEVT